MHEIIQRKLQTVEVDESVKILYACESGSRAWGFASTDSDYDVRFIYCHHPNWYLSICERRDVIERPLDENDLDISGWDIRKALGLFRKSNPPLLEWLNSPIHYGEHGAFSSRLRELMPSYYSPRNCLHHYMHMARGNFEKYLSGDTVVLKKYFYVLRPVLACNWIERGLGVVPMEFEKLMAAIAEPGPLREAINEILAIKKSGVELGEAPRIPAIHEYVATEIQRLSRLHEMAKPLKTETETLDELFRETLKEVWPNY